MDLLKMLFDEINRDHWGIPSTEPLPARRRREPVPRIFVAAGEAARFIVERTIQAMRGLLAQTRDGASEGEAIHDRRGAAVPPFPHAIPCGESRQADERLDRAA